MTGPEGSELDPLERFATSPDAPQPWRAIARRVAAGEFSWQDVREGRLCADETFLAALDSTIRQHREVSEKDDELGEDAGHRYTVPAW
ncbi:MAG: hypothetical protein ACRDI1_05175 [Actinomycetota bacterium]